MKKSDIQQIQKMLASTLGDFFDKVLKPYVDSQFKENDEDHDTIFRKLDQNQREHDRMFVRFDRLEEKVDGHESRIKKIEKTLQTS